MNPTLLGECEDHGELTEMQEILDEELNSTVRRAINPGSSSSAFNSPESSAESSNGTWNGTSPNQMAQGLRPEDVLEAQCHLAFEEFDTVVSRSGAYSTECVIARWIRDHHHVEKFQRRKLGIGLRGSYDRKLELNMYVLLFPTMNPVGNDCRYIPLIYQGRSPAFDGLIRASEYFGFRSSLSRALYTVGHRFLVMGANVGAHISYARFQSRVAELADSMPTMYHAWLSSELHSEPLMPEFHFAEDPFMDEEDTNQFFNVINRAFYEVISPDFSLSERGEPLQEIIKRKKDPRLGDAICQAYQNFKPLIPQGLVRMSEDACQNKVYDLVQFLELDDEDSEAGHVESEYNDNSGANIEPRDGDFDVDNAALIALPRGDIVRSTRGANWHDMPTGNRLQNDLAEINDRFARALRSLQEER